MSRYALTPRAAEDLADIWEFIFADKSPQRADAVIERIRESIKLVRVVGGYQDIPHLFAPE